MQATTKDLRLHTKALLSAIMRGEEVVITYHGRPRAKLVPVADVPDAQPSGIHNPAFALWQDRTDEESVAEQVRRMRRPRESGRAG